MSSITGRVVNQANIGAIHRAKVSLKFQGKIYVTHTDSEGIYSFSSVDFPNTGSFDGEIRIEANGYRVYNRLIYISSSNPQIEEFQLINNDEVTTNIQIKVAQITRQGVIIAAIIGLIGIIAGLLYQYITSGKHNSTTTPNPIVSPTISTPSSSTISPSTSTQIGTFIPPSSTPPSISIRRDIYTPPSEGLAGTEWTFKDKSGKTTNVEFLEDRSVRFTDTYYGTQGHWEPVGRRMIAFNTDAFSFRGQLTTDTRGMSLSFTELNNNISGKPYQVNYLTLYRIK